MTKEFDRTSVTTFQKLDSNYKLLLQRMKHFDEQIKSWSYPKNTLSIFTKELKKYLWILDKELIKIKESIDNHSQNNKNKEVAIWQLKLTHKKLILIRSQISQVYQKWDSRDPNNKVIKNQHSAESLEIYQDLSTRFLSLYDQYQRHNWKFITVVLDDNFEEEIEKEIWFLRFEVDYLTNISNMLIKIDLIHKQKNNICTWDLAPLKKSRRDHRTQKHYTLTSDIHSSKLKSDYDTRIKKSLSRTNSAIQIQEIFLLLRELSHHSELNKDSSTLINEILPILHLWDIHIIHNRIKNIITVEKLKKVLWYVQTKEILLQPFDYSSNFAKWEIWLIIHAYQTRVKWALPNDIHDYKNEQEIIQWSLHAISDSLNNIKNYRYTPFETLESAIAKNLKLHTRKGERWYIRNLLIQKLEIEYTKQYEYLISQVWNLTSWWRRNTSNSWDILSDIFSNFWSSWWRSKWISFGWGWSWGWWSFWWGWGFSSSWTSSGGTSR